MQGAERKPKYSHQGTKDTKRITVKSGFYVFKPNKALFGGLGVLVASQMF